MGFREGVLRPAKRLDTQGWTDKPVDLVVRLQKAELAPASHLLPGG